jgi:glycosyltransferase involved in cell wall biosynthesis
LYNMQGFRDAQQSVELLCRRNFPLETEAKKQGFKTHGFNSIFSVLFFLITKGKNYNVLHAQTSHILTYCVLTKPFHKATIIFSKRVDFVPKGFFTKLKYKLTDHVTVISSAIKTIFNTFGIPQVSVISDIAVKTTLDKNRAERILSEYHIPTEKKRIGTLAALVPHKAPLTMVEAIYLVSKQRQDFVFLHFGEGPLMQEVKQKIKDYNLSEVYKIMGFHQQVEDIFSVLDGFVMSSEEEGLGSSVLDAFLYEVPVASTNAGGLKDLLKDSRGEVCEIHAPEKLASCIHAMLDNSAKTQEMIRNAKTYVEQFHSMEYITNQYLVLIK